MFFVSGTRFFNETGKVLSGDTFKSGVLVQKNLSCIGKNYLQVHSKSVTHNLFPKKRGTAGGYCAARNKRPVFVFATFCTITRTPHLVGGPTSF